MNVSKNRALSHRCHSHRRMHIHRYTDQKSYWFIVTRLCFIRKNDANSAPFVRMEPLNSLCHHLLLFAAREDGQQRLLARQRNPVRIGDGGGLHPDLLLVYQQTEAIEVRTVYHGLTSSTYFKFLLFTFLWVVLRFILSFDGINGNKQLSLMLLDLLYPCIVSSFLILSRHYIVVGF